MDENYDRRGRGRGVHFPGTARHGPAGGACGGRGRGDRHRRLRLLLSAGDDGHHPPADDQRPQRRETRLRSDERLPPRAHLSAGRHEGGRAAEFRHLVFDRLARSDAGAVDSFGAGHERAVLPHAAVGHVDGCLCGAGPADHRHTGGPLRRGAARLAGHAPAGCPTHQRSHALCVGHRPHPDQRPRRLSRRTQGAGRLHPHPALALGAAAASRRLQTGPDDRPEDPAAGAGRSHAGRCLLQIRGGVDDAAAAASRGLVDHRAP